MSGSEETCLWCGAAADRLCDTLLHTETVLQRVDEFGRDREPQRRLKRIDSWNIPTCDAPICAGCSTSQLVRFSAGDDSRTETIDRCPYCVTQGRHAHLKVEAVGHRERCRAHGADVLARTQARPDAQVIPIKVNRPSP